ncbi:glutathione ABC transporter substrate-binding protein [Cytobacillus pseudoceanisediminis]|uniref:ABC transporter substrate-binding protein n=4 Tax=Cytobacillus TaxID=2675230 RepID=A0A160M805_9BACI|nr:MULTISPECIES: glutathione ABC transporter substrate-binding protein [Cytobacillus]EFV74874.1 oligopeptide ABC transporter [Bacillus sp. 2_A_57_CT2]MBY0155925.1 glutathione ABC transporter substrate-binding protein [Cytobacillus firmus]AND38680.1 ABC transporter substrate-binding protein [Cytobacillus oceanisediminis 2691]MBU8729926.1 glutathione ABC transporter substrate-binding protein [Cytobacillus oceanisediminis]MCM3390828.1 glutathione ABC transporter substrate-binding protein [Cytobac
MEKDRKHFRKGLLMIFLSLMMLLSTACSTQTKTEQEAGNESEGKKDGGTLTVVRLSDATKLDPHFITDIPSANIIYQKVYETLVEPDKDMNIQPLLATEWNVIDDTTWEFKLKEGVSFHDGTPFNSEAVKATFDRLLDPNTGSPQREKFAMINEVKVIDEYTVQLLLDYPYAPLLSILASSEGSIMSPKALAENQETLAEKPVGTGPFVFENWKTGQEISLKKNENYWGKSPSIDEVVFKVVPEDATRLAMIETGEAHINDQVPVTEIERIEASESMGLLRAEGLAVEYIGFNTKKKPLDDVKVRKAISHAVEREAIIKGVYNNVGTLANAAMSPKVFGHSEKVKPYDYDLNEAKKLLKEAGYENGLKLKLLTSDRKERINMAEVIQSQLKGIGVEVDIQVMEYGAYIDTIDKSEHDLFIGGWGNATGDGDYNQYNLFHTASQGPPGNHFYYSNPEVDKIIEEARRETDEAKRKDLYERVMQMELEDAVYIPIRNYEHMAAHSKNVSGFWLNAANYLMIDDAVIK